MRYLGVDLAWGKRAGAKQANRSGVVALDANGVIANAGWPIGRDETLRWIAGHDDEDALLFVPRALTLQVWSW